ncbi:hypothetical protein [Priestia koreensis]|uniref:hypothetical protein n=1 Tax=Priestia koreensis TaxID=284581 RepID=UPI0028F7111B|nr:hypothetical protein [Priestia koreensis]
MILYPPIQFDENEWFIIVSLLIVAALFIWLPNRFPPIITALLLLYIAAVAIVSDHVLGGAYKKNLYDFQDREKYEWFDVILQLFVYPLFGYLIYYVYDIWRQKNWHTIWFIVLATLFSTIFEGISVWFRVFVYTGWNLFYSFLFYLCIIPITIFLLEKMQHIQQYRRRVKKSAG